MRVRPLGLLEIDVSPPGRIGHAEGVAGMPTGQEHKVHPRNFSKTVSIKVDDSEVLEAALAHLQGGCTVRRLDAEAVQTYCEQVEGWMDTNGVPASRRAGVVVRVTGGHRLPASYAYPQASIVTAKRTRTGWTATTLERTWNDVHDRVQVLPWRDDEFVAWSLKKSLDSLR